MGTTHSLFRALVAGCFFIALPISHAQARPAQARTRSNPVPRLGPAAHTLSLPGEEVSIRYPRDWSLAHPTDNAWVLLNVRADQLETVEPTVRVHIGYLERGDHAAAVSELAEIATEYATPSKFLAIGGWPALQRVQRLARPQPSEAPPHPDPQMVQITTAVAVGSLLLRIDGRLPSDADQRLQALVLDIGRNLTFKSEGNAADVEQEIQRLNRLPMRSAPPPDRIPLPDEAPTPAALDAAAGANPILTLTQVPFGTNGELEIVASNDGANIVIVKQSSWITSNDGGQTFPFSGNLPVGDGDSSLAFGRSGSFYHSALGCFGTSCAAVCPANSNCAEMAVSTNNGQTFGALTNAAVCPNSGGGACSIDQEHIAADRFNTTGGGQDRVYMAFRQCQGGCGSDSRVTCSLDSGATWAPQLSLENNADFPRVAVGSDGFFYVVYRRGGDFRIDKYNACSTNAAVMTRAAGGFPKTVSAFTTVPGCEVANGFPGLDRCNDGNLLSSPTVAVDDTNANHVYVAWATNTATGPSPGLGNENVMVADSIDGGVTWGAAGHTPVIVNSGTNGRRIMPWVCPSAGQAFVTWYDRRNATAGNNDLQDYFAASAGLSGGNLVPNNDEFRISTATDATCTTWPRGPRSTFDSENCSVQPQDAGNCSVTTSIRCDFGGDGTVCPMGETCQTGNGAVKYGDYNGNYCVLGRLYTVFASSAGQPTTGAPRNFYQSFVVTSTPTTTTYTGDTTGDYHDDVTLAGKLTLSGTQIGIAGQTLTFTIGAQSCNGTTTASGAASCTLNLNQVPGPYTVSADFAGSGLYQASSSPATPFIITKEETTLSYTGPTVIANGSPVTLSGVLREDGVVPIAGRTVSFTLGAGGSAQTCSGTTDAAGSASCTVPVVNQPLGANTVGAAFLGDAFYLPSSASANIILFAFLARGAFVVGDQTATGAVEFWGDDWADVNLLSGGAAPSAFKGFAARTSTPPACGGTWTSRPGNSSNPPKPPLPAYMGVIVSTAVNKSGPMISGNVFKIVVVTTDPGYKGNPGHHGTGTVVANYCP
jgi:hypothetical protein